MVGELLDFPEPQLAKQAANTDETTSKMAARSLQADPTGRVTLATIPAV